MKQEQDMIKQKNKIQIHFKTSASNFTSKSSSGLQFLKSLVPILILKEN